MSFGHHTPESLLARSDSKNPATTCKGITTSGRSCRRALATSTDQFSHEAEDGVLAILDAGDAAAFFCWQHKDQADVLVARLQERTQVFPLRKRSSIDTLAERVGVLEIEDDEEVPFSKYQDLSRRQPKQHAIRKKDRLPPEWRHLQGPLLSVPEEVISLERAQQPACKPSASRQRLNGHANRPARSGVQASWRCCAITDDGDHTPPTRRRPQQKTSNSSPMSTSVGLTHERRTMRPATVATSSDPVRRKPVSKVAPEMERYTDQRPPRTVHEDSPSKPVTPVRPQIQPRHSSTSPPNSQTMAFLSYIPPHLSPVVTSTLLAELSRPISEADEEGYIYIFWLTPESGYPKPEDDTASHLLDPDGVSGHPHSFGSGWRHQDSSAKRGNAASNATHVLQRYASTRRNAQDPGKILLKIGRATNVHRRLSQWTKQCGQNVTLIRYYPHVPVGSSNKPPAHGTGMGTVPHVHRVERLIHLELAEQRVTDKEQCLACGRSHKEWFEVEATRRGLQDVDEVVKRWVTWAQLHHVNSS